MGVAKFAVRFLFVHAPVGSKSRAGAQSGDHTTATVVCGGGFFLCFFEDGPYMWMRPLVKLNGDKN